MSAATRAAIESGNVEDPAIRAEMRENLRHSPATRFDVLQTFEHAHDVLGKRISALEKALAFAQAEAAKALQQDIEAFIAPAPDLSLDDLERMAERHRKDMETR
jgi:hypothetical protein